MKLCRACKTPDDCTLLSECSKPRLTLDQQLKIEEEIARIKREERILLWKPHPKQCEFYAAGATLSQVMLTAGNQQGKTETEAAECVYHLTGEYPDDWPGHRFKEPIRAWICGTTATEVRNIQQTKLCGPYASKAEYGTGLIPKRAFLDYSLGRGATDAFDTIVVKHKSGGKSTAQFKSYEQGREKFQGEPVPYIWLDEEPDEDIYTECLARTTAVNGIIRATMTPLKGPTPYWSRFSAGEGGRKLINMGINDALHIPVERRQAIIDSYPRHQRKARVMGLPYLEAGAVFEDVTFEQISVPYYFSAGELWDPRLEGAEFNGQMQTAHLFKLWAIDFGIGHPFAAVLLFHDRDTDIIYAMYGLKMVGGSAADHASRMRAIAPSVPVAWPHDGNAREKGSGQALADIYKKEGLLMLPMHATFEHGGYDFEAGVMLLLGRMRKGTFKVSEKMHEFMVEFGTYRRGENGLVVKENDDLMSATRIGCMQIRSARQGGVGALRYDPHSGKMVPTGMRAGGMQVIQPDTPDDIWNG